MKALISIIVPVYNTEEYLQKCVQSVLKQSYPYFELLLVDDGSRDGSAEVCKALCDADQRVRFLPQPHRGVSATRNAGIDAAKGEYIFFLDSDDTIYPRILEALVELCESTGAALATEVYRHIETTDVHSYMDSLDVESNTVWEYTYMDNPEALRQFSSRENGYNFHGIGGKMVRRNALGTLRFDEKLENGEDTIFVYQLLDRGLDAVILWEEWYEYWKHGKNASERLTVQSCEDSYQCLRYICRREQEREEVPCGGEVTFWTLVISARFRRFYVRSRKEHNREVSKYLRALARYEAQSDRFSRLSLSEKWKHYLAFWCFPLYLPVHRISTRMWQRKEQEREQRREARYGE